MPACGPWPRRIAWLLLVQGFAVTPLLVYQWLFVVAEGRGSDLWHVLGGTFNITRSFFLTLTLAIVFLRLADFAEALARELSTVGMASDES